MGWGADLLAGLGHLPLLLAQDVPVLLQGLLHGLHVDHHHGDFNTLSPTMDATYLLTPHCPF